MKATRERRGRDNLMTPGCTKDSKTRTSLAEGAALEDVAPVPVRRPHATSALPAEVSRGRGLGEGSVSPNCADRASREGVVARVVIQLWSPAADPLLTCTKSTKFMDNCQPGVNSRPNRREQDELRGVDGRQPPDSEQQQPRKQRTG